MDRLGKFYQADHNASKWLAIFNDLDEAGKGHTKKAEDAYRKAQFWLDRMNKMNGET